MRSDDVETGSQAGIDESPVPGQVLEVIERDSEAATVNGVQGLARFDVDGRQNARMHEREVGPKHGRPRRRDVIGRGPDGVDGNERMARNPVAKGDGMASEAIRERRRLVVDEDIGGGGRLHSATDVIDGGLGTVAVVSHTERAVDVADVPVLLTAADATRAEAIDALLADLPAASAPPRIAIRHDGASPPVPERAPDSTAFDGDAWFGDATVHIRLSMGGGAFASDASATIGGGGRDTFKMLFPSALAHVMAFHDRFVLHAGAVADGGDGYIVLGDTGAGKSTLGLAALEAGWNLLGDDMVVIRRSGTKTEMAGVPRPAAVPSDLGSPLATSPLVSDVRGRALLPVDTLHTGWVPVTGVISVGHAPLPAGSVDPISGRESLRAVLRAFTWTRNPQLLRRFFGTAAALSRLPSWDLRLGAEPHRRLVAAAGHLAAVTAVTGV